MAFTKSYRKGSKARDIYAEVTDRIVSALESGVAPWVRPWRALGASGDLRNGETGRAYSGVNVMLLGLTMDAQGYSDPRWLTFKQARKLGGHVRKGEKGSLVVFWKPLLIRDKGNDERTASILPRTTSAT